MFVDEHLQEIIDSLIKDYDLPEGSIYQYSNLSNKGINKGKEISKSICISEPDYPTIKGHRSIQNKSYVIMNIQAQNNFELLLIRNNQFKAISLPQNAEVKDVCSDTSFKHVVFYRNSNEMFKYIKENIIYCIDNYSPSSSFGCCSKYEQCSRVKKCLHVNKLYSKGCSYRKNLEQGKIFY